MHFSRFISALVMVAVATAAPRPIIEEGTKACQNPDIRKEWRQLTSQEQQEFVNAFNCFAKTPEGDKLQVITSALDPALTSSVNEGSKRDEVPTQYIEYTRSTFLPWNRWLLNMFSNGLKEQCGYSGPFPYWNVFQDADDICKSTRAVIPGVPVDNATLERILKEVSQGSLHNSGVGGVVGDPATHYSPNDPLFFLHHGFIDMLWSEWQQRNPLNQLPILNQSGSSSKLSRGETTSSLPTLGLLPVKTVADVMNTQGGYLCYKYD